MAKGHKGSSKSSTGAQEEKILFVEHLKRQWMAMIDALVDPMMIVDRDYQIKKANKAMAALAGSNVKDIINHKCYTVFAGRSSPCDGCQLIKAATNKASEQWSLSQVRNDRYYEVTSQPIIDEDSNIDGVVQVYRDRTEAKKLQEQLLQSEKLASIGLLAGGIAHEINNPLGGITIFSQMLLRELPKDSPHYQDVEEIHNATKRCKSIVENLLNFARSQPAGKPEALESVDLTEAATTALRFGRVGLMNPNVHIVEEWNAADPYLSCNRNKVIQVFLNLIQNAFQAMPDGGTLTLRSYNRAQQDQNQLVFECEDTGVGIPKEYMSRVFDPFFTTKEPGEGTGLGLAICYGIVEDLGGHMDLESEVNQGTVFRVTFPAIDKHLNKTA